MKNIIVKLISYLFGHAKRIDQGYKYNIMRAKYDIDDSFRFNGDGILFYGEGKIKINENTYIGSGSAIEACGGRKVDIGRNCSISHNVRIYTSSNISNQNFDTSLKKQRFSGDVIIGNGVWIGANVFINPGVIIGNNVVIGANSVITKDIEDKSIVGGVPAKLIRRKDV